MLNILNKSSDIIWIFTTMKKASFVLISLIFFIACSKRTIPAKTNNTTIVYNNNNITNTDSSYNKTDSVAAPLSSKVAFLVISNGYGKIINGQQALPADGNINFDELQLSKGFSAQQLTNLKTRYNTIPPRVLYVNPANQLNSARGSYFVFAKKILVLEEERWFVLS